MGVEILDSCRLFFWPPLGLWPARLRWVARWDRIPGKHESGGDGQMLDAAAIQARLGDARLGAEIRALTSVTSTSDIAWAWADAGCPEGTVVFAEEQVRGRGRFGRTWQCPRGRGLLMSIVLRPESGGVGPAHLTAAGALAVAEAVGDVAGLAAAIRWPNDVTARGLKLAGVLVEQRGHGVPGPCVLGVGVNVNVAREEFAEELVGAATSLSAEAGREFPLEEVAAAVLVRLDARYWEACGGRWAGVAGAWRERCALVGERVEVTADGQRLRGRVVGADPLAGLELEVAGGGRHVCRPEATSLVLPRAEA